MLTDEIKNWLINPENEYYLIDNRTISKKNTINNKFQEFQPENFSGFAFYIKAYMVKTNNQDPLLVKLFNTFVNLHNIEGVPGSRVNNNSLLLLQDPGITYVLLSVLINDDAWFMYLLDCNNPDVFISITFSKTEITNITIY